MIQRTSSDWFLVRGTRSSLISISKRLSLPTRRQHDIIHYTDHDLITHKDGSARRYLRRDGTEYKGTT